MNDHTPNILNLQLRALAQIRRQLETNGDRLIRIENKMESVAQNVDRLNRKANHDRTTL